MTWRRSRSPWRAAAGGVAAGGRLLHRGQVPALAAGSWLPTDGWWDENSSFLTRLTTRRRRRPCSARADRVIGIYNQNSGDEAKRIAKKVRLVVVPRASTSGRLDGRALPARIESTRPAIAWPPLDVRGDLVQARGDLERAGPPKPLAHSPSCAPGARRDLPLPLTRTPCERDREAPCVSRAPRPPRGPLPSAPNHRPELTRVAPLLARGCATLMSPHATVTQHRLHPDRVR